MSSITGTRTTSEARQTLHDAVSTAMKYAVWVKPGQSPSDDVYYVAMAGMGAPQIGPDYDCEHEAGKACYALNVDAAIAVVLDRLRQLAEENGFLSVEDIEKAMNNKWTGDGLAENDRIEALQAENAKLREALTPSASTKAAYMTEFSWTEPDFDECGGRTLRQIVVPWTVIKTIMATIRARAALQETGQ